MTKLADAEYLPPPRPGSAIPGVWPTHSEHRIITSQFGPRARASGGPSRLHKGIDIDADRKSPIYTAADGIVSYSGIMSGYGNIIIVDHGNGMETRYGHLNRRDVEVGAKVRQGSRIGLAGSTGNSSAPHLHYEVRIDDKPVDPMRYLP